MSAYFIDILEIGNTNRFWNTWRCCSSGFWRRVDSLVDKNVSEKRTVSVFSPEDRNSMFLQPWRWRQYFFSQTLVSTYLRVCTASQQRTTSSSSPPTEPQISETQQNVCEVRDYVWCNYTSENVSSRHSCKAVSNTRPPRVQLFQLLFGRNNTHLSFIIDIPDASLSLQWVLFTLDYCPSGNSEWNSCLLTSYSLLLNGLEFANSGQLLLFLTLRMLFQGK
jgi:hypothetical protein